MLWNKKLLIWKMCAQISAHVCYYYVIYCVIYYYILNKQ